MTRCRSFCALRCNPKWPAIDRAIGQIVDQYIKQRFEQDDFGAAWELLELVSNRFPSLKIISTDRWRERLQKMAEQRLDEGLRHLKAKNYDQALAAARAAIAIRPGWDQARTLADRVQRARPQVVVAVESTFRGTLSSRLDDWVSRRVRPLTDRSLVELRGYGAEGGIYASPLGDIVPDVAGGRLTIVLKQSGQGSAGGWNAYSLSRRLLAAVRNEDSQVTDLSTRLGAIEAEDAKTLHLDWSHPHVRPEAFLQIDLSDKRLQASDEESPATALGPFRFTKKSGRQSHFERRPPIDRQSSDLPVEIVERQYENEAEAIEALREGQIDIIERVSPWNRKQLAKMPGVVVKSYALPTVHALLLNPDGPLLGRSEMRRAIAYGIDRPAILKRIILAGELISGVSLVSGPFPIGRDLNDPIAYGYNRQVVQRPYSPHLAATLAAVARQTQAEGAGKDPASESRSPLVLAHPPGDFCRTVCQVLAQQLGRAGIPVELAVVEPTEWADRSIAWDLRYAELAMWEPVVDAPRLLGPRGEAGIRNAYLALALRKLEEAQNWAQVRERLNTVHRVTYNELAVIPLWQTVNAFAYRDNLDGIGEAPVTLYDNVADWRKMLNGTRP